ncbi:MAG: ABC transporter permease [Chitinophagales bacterium]|nr:ABC transporter permease [Chitinophagales bacterium]
MLFILAWRNMWRNRNRTLITMASIFFAVLLAILTRALQKGVFDNVIKNVVSYYTGYIQIHKTGYWDEQILDNAFVLNDTLIRELNSNPNLTAFAPRLESFALASSGEKTQGCLISGVEPAKESSIIHLQQKISEGTYIESNDRAVMIGSDLADKLQLELNDTVLLLGQGYHGATAGGKYPIKAILKFGSPDLNSRMLFLPLKEAQNLFGSESLVSTIVLQPRDVTEALQVKTSLQATIGKEYEVMAWQDMSQELVQHMNTENVSTYVMFGVLLLLVSFGIFGTLLMMLAERQHEFGMLVAIGMKRIQLSVVLVIECVLTTMAGSMMGVIVSFPVVFYFARHPIRFGGELADLYVKYGFEPIFPTSTAPDVFYVQAIIVFIVGLLLSLYPVVTVIKLKPTAAMRK